MTQVLLSTLTNQLVSSPAYSPLRELRNTVPYQVGVYVWTDEAVQITGQMIVYAGIATGKKGLYGRIIGQPLNPKYLLTNRAKWHFQKDKFQIDNPILSNGKEAIDKSAFRKNVGRLQHIRAGEETVRFIKENFNLKFIVLPSELAKLLESEIIRIYEPRYNIASKPVRKASTLESE